MADMRNPQARQAAAMVARNFCANELKSNRHNTISAKEANLSNYAQERKQLLKIVKFEVILLSYMFYNDDMKLSRTEKKQIKSFISVAIPNINKEELKDMVSVIKLKPEFGDIIRIKEAYKFSNKGVSSLIDEMKAVSNIKRYQELLTKLQNYFE